MKCSLVVKRFKRWAGEKWGARALDQGNGQSAPAELPCKNSDPVLLNSLTFQEKLPKPRFGVSSEHLKLRQILKKTLHMANEPYL